MSFLGLYIPETFYLSAGYIAQTVECRRNYHVYIAVRPDWSLQTLFTNHYLLSESFGNRGITSSSQCEVATDKSKGINLRNFIVGCCSFVQEYRGRRYPVVGHASL